MSLLIDALNAADARAAEQASRESAGALPPKAQTMAQQLLAASPSAAHGARARRLAWIAAAGALAAVAAGAWLWWSAVWPPRATTATPASTHEAEPPAAAAVPSAEAPPSIAPPTSSADQARPSTAPAAAPAKPPATARRPAAHRLAPDGAAAGLPAASRDAPRAGALAPRAAPQPAAGLPAASRDAAQTGGTSPGAPAIHKATVLPPLAEAYAALAAGRLDEAERLYREAAALQPRHPDVLLGLAAAAERRGDRPAAAAAYARVLEIEPDHPVALAAVAELSGAGDAGVHESALRLALARQPAAASLHRALGRLLAQQSRWSEALQSFAAAWELEPHQPAYAYDLAVAYDRLRRAPQAAALYRRAAALAGDGAAAGFDTAAALARAATLESLAHTGPEPR